MSKQMIEVRRRYVERYGDSYGRIMFVNECQRKGIDPVTGAKMGGVRHE